MSTKPKIWQVACGDAGREYWGWFLDYDVMCIGPGEPGKWSANNKDKYLENDKKSGQTNSSIVRQFAENVREGDIVLLRKHWGIITAGVIYGKYSWKLCFDDVNGWDLQHCWRVCWNKKIVERNTSTGPSKNFRFCNQQKEPRPIRDIQYKVRRPFSGVDDENMKRAASEIAKSIDPSECQLIQLPEPVIERERSAVVSELNFLGDKAEGSAHIIENLMKIIKYYLSSSIEREPSEFETRSHIVVPLLKALGWPCEQIVVEKDTFDIVLLKHKEDKPKDCLAAFELKKLKAPLGGVRWELEKRVKDKETKNCKLLVVTNGVRYMISKKNESGTWKELEPDVDKCANLRKKTFLSNLKMLTPEYVKAL